jgi:hypothetical protein
MKKFSRSLLGLISSLLFTCGFARAAQHCDPLTVTAQGHVNVSGVAPSCVEMCNAVEN